MTQHLFLFQIGPVQSFIAAARRTQDLYVGSRILSILASAGVKAALSQGVDLLFPASDQDGNLPSSIPHRFAFISDHPQPANLAEHIETAIRKEWSSIAGSVKNWLLEHAAGNGDWQTTFDEQVKVWLEFNWVAVAYNPADHGGAYGRAVRAMATRKASRTFVQVNEAGRKCTLSGAQTALNLDWSAVKRAIHDGDNIVLRPNEVLGSLATIKRFAGRKFAAVHPDIDETRFPDTTRIAGGVRDQDDETLYFAVLHMDGDKMGQRLAGMQRHTDHHTLSYKLAVFAEQMVPEIIHQKVNEIRVGRDGEARLVYAGGDDVLALLPLWAVLPVADAIRQKFAAEIGGTMSAGISITPHKHPFSFALDEARLAEKRAKSHYGRNAVVIRQNIGQIREAGAPWEVISFAYKMQFCFENQFISGKYGFDLLELAHQLAVESIVPPEAITDEAIRILKRRKADGLDPQIIIELAEDVSRFGKMPIVGWERLANWIIIARFLAKQRADLPVLNTQGESA